MCLVKKTRVAGVMDVMYEFKYPSSNIKFIKAEGYESTLESIIAEIQSNFLHCVCI